MNFRVEADNNNSFSRDFPPMYYEQYPARGGCVDVSALRGKPEFSYAGVLLQWLQRGSETWLPCSGSSPDLSAMEALYYEQQSMLFREGRSTLALGFPILRIVESPDQVLSVPVFLWEVKLNRHPEFFSEWVILSKGRKRARLNPFIAAWLRSFEGADIGRLAAFLQNGEAANLWLPALYELLSTWIPGLVVPVELERLVSHPFRFTSDAGQAANQLLSAGVLGFFPAFFAEEKSLPPSVAVDNGIPRFTHTHRVFPLPADPSQQAVLDFVGEGTGQLEVSGAVGTGKTHTLVQLLWHALSMGKKVLVLSPSVSGLREIQQYLSDERLADLYAVLTDLGVDGDYFLSLLTKRGNDSFDTSRMESEADWKRASDGFHRLLDKLDRQYAAVRTKVFGELSWPELLGLFLQSSQIAGKDRMDAELTIPGFVFDDKQYHDLRRVVLTGEVLYSGMNVQVRHLAHLSPDIFLTKHKSDARAWVAHGLEKYKGRAIELRRALGDFSRDYTDALLGDFQDGYIRIKDQLELVAFVFRSAEQEFGTSWENAVNDGLFWKRFLGKRYAAMQESKASVIREWGKLVELVGESSLAHHGLPRAKLSRDIPEIKQLSKSFARSLREWGETIPRLAQDAAARLGAKTIREELHLLDPWENLERELSDLVEAMNGSGLFARVFEDVMLSLSRKGAFLDEIIGFIEGIVSEMSDFEAFFDWHRFWLGLPEDHQVVLKGLIRLRSSNWEESFKSWFFYQALLASGAADFPRQPSDFSSLAGHLENLRQQYPVQIARVWRDIRADRVKRTKRRFLSSRDKGAFAAGTSMDGSWFDTHFEAITALAPVLLFGSAAAEKLLPGLKQSFDLVLVDDAEAVASGLLPLLKTVGKQGVFFYGTTPLAALPGAGESMRLAICHRWPPGCMDLLVDTQTQISTEGVRGFEVQFVQVDGRFDALAGANETEAMQVVQLLNGFEETPQRTMPRVIIAALTKAQRNLIAAAIDRIKYSNLPGVERIRQLERNGLLVCAASDLRGVQADVLVISATVGPINIKGELPDDLSGWSVSLLEDIQLLASRTGQKVFVLNSIPETLLYPENLSLSFSYGLSGAYLLHYLAYLRVLGGHGADAQGEVIASLRKYLGYPEMGGRVEGAYAERLYDRIASGLSLWIPRERIIRNFREAQFDFALVIHGADPSSPKVVIHLDGYWSEAAQTNMEWELQRTVSVSSYGYRIVSTFSIYWLLDPDGACRRLAAAIGES